MTDSRAPRVVLICHEEDSLDSEGLAAWLASSMQLAGMVLLRETRGAKLRRALREFRRTGPRGFLDVLAMRFWYRLRHARRDQDWMRDALASLRAKYPADPSPVTRITATSPNLPAVRDFLRRIEPDFVIARCKFMLRSEIFRIPSCGTYVLHPGICPEYRNSHGCFWALAERDLKHVGMTLLRVDEGVDTGPVFLHASYEFDERRESHIVVQYRAVIENLDRIASTLIDIHRGRARPIHVEGRSSAAWGQPRLSAYLRWRRAMENPA